MAACLLHERWSSGNLVRPGKAILNFTCQGPGAKEAIFKVIGGWLTKPDLHGWLTESRSPKRWIALKGAQFLPNSSLFKWI
jgi:hypothetical protein